MSRCPCCKAQKKRVVGRRTTPREWKKFHPLAGHEHLKERGWTDPEAERLHNLEVKRRRRSNDAKP